MTTREAASLYQRTGQPVPADLAAPAPEKVRNTRRKIVDGIEFRSTLEAEAYQLLRTWEKAGAITYLKLQPKFVLQPKMRRFGQTIRAITYTPDFSCTLGWSGRPVVVDAKGYRMEVYKLKRKLFMQRYPDTAFWEWTRADVKELQ